MKIKTIISFLILVCFVFSVQVNAQENSEKFRSQKFLEDDAKIIEPGVLPNSFWYWGDIFEEEIRYVFTIGKEKKADYLILLAEERLAEMKTLSEAGITKYTERILSKYEIHIRKAEELYEKLKMDGAAKVKEKQEELERGILENEYKIKKELKQFPDNYIEKRDSFIGKIMYGFRQIKDHLTGKRQKIEDQRAGFEE